MLSGMSAMLARSGSRLLAPTAARTVWTGQDPLSKDDPGTHTYELPMYTLIRYKYMLLIL